MISPPGDPSDPEPGGDGAPEGGRRLAAEVRFVSGLNDFLAPVNRERPMAVEVAPGTTVKDAVEALGVPHTEVDVILVNGESVPFARPVAGGDRIVVYPRLEAFDAGPLVRLLPPVPACPRFVLDVHLGKLARDLRLLGFDAEWCNDADDEALVATSVGEGRIVLTRDRGLLKRRALSHGYFVRATRRDRQTEEVLRHFDLYRLIEPFGRCLECNGRLEDVAKSEVEDRLPPRTRRDYDDFRRCTRCGRVYWRGSHYDRLRARVGELRRRGVPVSSGGTLGTAALEAVRRGWSVVPLHTVSRGVCSCGDRACPAPGKHPHVAWDPFMHDAASEEEVVRWWRRWPHANVGIVTGAVSNLVVLDVDPRHGGGETLADLETVHGRLPPTVEVLTGGGGQHLYFRHPGTPVASRPIAPGLDLKGDGGLVVAPPSLHVTGRCYAWEAECAPGEAALALFPAWLANRLPDGRVAVRGERPATDREAPARTHVEQREFADLWTLLGVALEPGDRYYLCPFHPDHRPSLHVDAEGCRFYCFGCARGGGLGRLRRLVAGRRGLRPSRPVESELPHDAVTVHGLADVEVVGVSGHQDTLLELTGGRRHYSGVHISTTAQLAPEPANPVDPEAIEVVIDGRMVGHLSRADAARYRAEVLEAIERHGAATCAATIVGGWERQHGDVGYFGVRLRL